MATSETSLVTVAVVLELPMPTVVAYIEAPRLGGGKLSGWVFQLVASDQGPVGIWTVVAVRGGPGYEQGVL